MYKTVNENRFFVVTMGNLQTGPDGFQLTRLIIFQLLPTTMLPLENPREKYKVLGVSSWLELVYNER